ncbi:hypothetical protein Ciccas_012361 [Cichlidogyrus casuarinus]|uniref:Uncharacterized protein n=1 Tax=Cichlidogyrus casuarinus TaxID=1844966 RepID=A0ABD2PP25_9PLAT
MVPLCNNAFSLICGITIFSTVFSTILTDNPAMSKDSILLMMQESGPASSGLTFTWIPVLFAKVGSFGRFLCPLFFLCLAFSGITSLISTVQFLALTVEDMGMPPKISIVISIAAYWLFGLPSALSIHVLANQDYTWSYALIVSGAIYCALVIRYGVEKYRKYVVNAFGLDDWKLVRAWTPLVLICVPIQAIVLLFWWTVKEILNNPSTWYIPNYETFIMVIIEWSAIIILIVVFTVCCVKFKPAFFDKVNFLGFDPHNEYCEQKIPDGLKLEAAVFNKTREIEILPKLK